MGKEKIEKPEEFHGQHVFTAAAGVIKLLMIAYLLNAAVYSIGALITLGVCLLFFGSFFFFFDLLSNLISHFFFSRESSNTPLSALELPSLFSGL